MEGTVIENESDEEEGGDNEEDTKEGSEEEEEGFSILELND